MIRSNRMLCAAALTATMLAAGRASATVDAIVDHWIVTEEIQTGELCYRTVPVWGVFGIAPAVSMRATFSEIPILRVNAGVPDDTVNINAVYTSPPMVASYVSDSYTEDGVWEYEMTVDVSGLAAANGRNPDGRAATVRAAKLGLLAMAKNMDALSGGRYRLRVTFQGLPSQEGLAGTTLPARTRSPYSAASPVLRALEAELIGGHCDDLRP
jgi:hypothetical protein